MNPFLKLQYKTRIGLLLAGLLLCLLINNIAGRESIGEMEQAANSIYADRLLPSTYIFQITEHLHQERALLQAAPRNQETARRQQFHEQAILELIAKYELTALTREERIQWNRFKTHLHVLHSAPNSAAALEANFASTLKCLATLNLIQASEGKHLQASMRAIIGSTSLRSHLETVLLLVIGGLTLRLIGISKSIFDQTSPHSPSLN